MSVPVSFEVAAHAQEQRILSCFSVPGAAFAQCHCDKPGDAPCTRRATEEDLLCDICRPGCTVLTIPGVSVSAHMELVGFGKRESS